MCEHRNAFEIMGGWFCPDCKKVLDKKPEPKDEPKKPKKKKES